MNLQIRDPEVRKKAERLAKLQNVTLTKAVGDALDFRIKHLPKRPLREIAEELHAEMKALSKGEGHIMTKDEIDAMWGQ